MKKLIFCLTFFSVWLALGAPRTSEVSPVQVPEKLLSKMKSFEPSGAVYLADLDRFLVASDDTTKNDDPWLFVMDAKGNVEANPIKIQGVSEMTDMESISHGENGILYILGSQGLNKSGKDLVERNLFVKAQRNGRQIQALQVIELRPLLLEALNKSKIPEIKELKHQFDELLDIESHFIQNGNLFVGLKEPQVNGGKAMVLNVGSVDFLFQNERLQGIQRGLNFNFAEISNHADLLSEMLPFGDKLILTTTSEELEGRVWSYDIKTGALKILKEFKNLRPEAITYDTKNKAFLIFFDEGEEQPLFQRVTKF